MAVWIEEKEGRVEENYLKIDKFYFTLSYFSFLFSIQKDHYLWAEHNNMFCMQKWKKGITLHGVKENTHELANWCSTIITEEPSVLIPKATLFLDEANYMERRWLYLCVVKTLHSCSLINSFTCIYAYALS